VTANRAPASARALKVLFLAFDGTSAGHVTRALAIAGALSVEGPPRGIAVRPLLATSSRAEALLAFAGVPAIRLPPLAESLGAGFGDGDRRRLAAGVLEGIAEGFAPDVLVADTFPSGPDLEAAGLIDRVPLRVLVRRTIRPERAADAAARAGLERYDLIVLPGDPGPSEPGPAGLRSVRVPPITIVPAGGMAGREEARRALGIPEGRVALVACGGGGDPEAAGIVAAVAENLREDGRFAPFVATGPLARGVPNPPVPLARWLRAFDAAVLAAGYNSAHEAAAAGLPLALFARPRRFDDQAARARRFEAAGLAVRLPSLDAVAIRRALDDLPSPRPLQADGARAVARAVLDLAEGRS
jgi:predicted glycosyltransferase